MTRKHRPSRPIPVGSFDPRLIRVLIIASRQRIELGCDSPQQASALLHRIHACRVALIREQPDFGKLLERARFSRQDTSIIGYPQDSQFSHVLDGIEDIDIGDFPEADKLLQRTDIVSEDDEQKILQGLEDLERGGGEGEGD